MTEKRFDPAALGWKPESVLLGHLERMIRDRDERAGRCGTYKPADIEPMPAPLTKEQVEELMRTSRRATEDFIEGHGFPVPIYGRRKLRSGEV